VLWRRWRQATRTGIVVVVEVPVVLVAAAGQTTHVGIVIVAAAVDAHRHGAEMCFRSMNVDLG